MNSDDRPSGSEQSEEDLLPEPLPLEALFHRYGIERSHADNVARNVLSFLISLIIFTGWVLKCESLRK